eukprot:1051191-Prymnesium_polylepis.1
MLQVIGVGGGIDQLAQHAQADQSEASVVRTAERCLVPQRIEHVEKWDVDAAWQLAQALAD